MLTIITLPADFASSTLDITSAVATDFTGLFQLVVGVMLAVIVLVLLVRVFLHH